MIVQSNVTRGYQKSKESRIWEYRSLVFTLGDKCLVEMSKEQEKEEQNV